MAAWHTPGLVSSHLTAVCASAVLDTQSARQALVGHLVHAGAGPRSSARWVSHAALAAAAIGLAPRPAGGLAESFAPEERKALEGAVAHIRAGAVSQAAELPLRAWDGGWAGQTLRVLEAAGLAERSRAVEPRRPFIEHEVEPQMWCWIAPVWCWRSSGYEKA